MKYKFFYSLSFFALYGATAGLLLAVWHASLIEGGLCLIACLISYFLLKARVYYAKEWILASLITLILLWVSLWFLSHLLAFGVGISYLGASFIQVYLDEMCRSKEKL